MKIFESLTKKLALLFAVALVLTACGDGGKGNDVAVTVNGVDIPLSEYEEEYRIVAEQMASQYGPEFLQEPGLAEDHETMGEEIRDNILTQLTQFEIVKQDAAKSDITVSDEEFKEKMDQTIEMFGGEEQFQAAIEQQNLTKEYYEKYLRNQILLHKYSQAKMEEMKPTEEELQKYYEEHKDDFNLIQASHILVATEDEAKNLKQQLNEGASFEELAKAHSTDTASGEKGGDLGEFGKGTMVKEFDDQVFKMKPGEISEPFKTQFGWHIARVDAVIDNMDEIRFKVEEQYTQEKFVEYMDNLEKSAKVKRHVDPKDEIEIDLSKYEGVKKEESTTNVPAESQGNNQQPEQPAEKPAEGEGQPAPAQ